MDDEGHKRGVQIADTVAKRIETLIVDGMLKPGQALPSERSLSARLNVSRSSVREGLMLLRARGVIDTAQGRRSVVALLTSQPGGSPMMHLVNSQPRTLYDIFEVREILEAESARLAALRGTQADFALITRRYEEMVAATTERADTTTCARLDHAFHLAICEASHNPLLVHTLSSITDLLLTSVAASVNNLYHRDEERRVIDKQHARLYQAVLSRQSEQARKIASAHIDSTIASLREIESAEQPLLKRLPVCQGIA